VNYADVNNSMLLMHGTTYSKNSHFALATIWQKPLSLPCKNRTSQRKKPAEMWQRMHSIELFIFA